MGALSWRGSLETMTDEPPNQEIAANIVSLMIWTKVRKIIPYKFMV
jgi:hypothetical protein